MSHSTTLDNGIIINYDGGDTGGIVHISMDGKMHAAGHWENIVRADTLKSNLEKFGRHLPWCELFILAETNNEVAFNRKLQCNCGFKAAKKD